MKKISNSFVNNGHSISSDLEEICETIDSVEDICRCGCSSLNDGDDDSLRRISASLLFSCSSGSFKLNTKKTDKKLIHRTSLRCLPSQGNHT